MYAVASNRTGCEVAQILPNTAVSSGVRGKAYNTPPPSPKNPTCGKAHLSPSHSCQGREIDNPGDAHFDKSQIGLPTVWGVDLGLLEKTGINLPLRGQRLGA